MSLLFIPFLVLGLGAQAFPSPAAGEDPNLGARGKEVRVTASRLNVRNEEGRRVCSVPRGTLLSAIGRDGDEDRVRVRFNAKGCPSEGYVYSNYVVPTGATSQEVTFKVNVSQLALRGFPGPEGRFRCGLPEDTSVTIVQEDPPNAVSGSWAKVSLSNPPAGCPSEGFLNTSYLNGSDAFNDLPIVSGRSPAPSTNAEGGLGCPNGNCEQSTQPSASTKNAEDLTDVRDYLDSLAPKNSFLEALREMIKDPTAKPAGYSTHRGLIQLPLQGNIGNIGACGSFHYNPDQPKGIDAYTDPVTACAFTAFLQDWKKTECPDGGGCRVAWGDISHKTKARFSGHATHTDGHCIDIRPLRKGPFENSPLSIGQSKYDREKMRTLIAKMKEFGADSMYFNDRQLGTPRASGHHNHIHVCFKPGPKTRTACQNLTIDPNTCPELL